MSEPVKIARCPIHGFVGERDVLRFHDGEERCLICDGDPDLTTEIERVEMVPASEIIGYLVALPGYAEGVFTPDWDGEIHQHQGKAEESLWDAKSNGFDDAVLTALVRLPDPATLPTSTPTLEAPQKAEAHPGEGTL